MEIPTKNLASENNANDIYGSNKQLRNEAEKVSPRDINKPGNGIQNSKYIVHSDNQVEILRQCTSGKTCVIPKLFSHLYYEPASCGLIQFNLATHSSVLNTGEQFSSRSIVGCNARCIAFLYAVRSIALDYSSLQKEELARALESNLKSTLDYFLNFRTQAVSIVNACKYLKFTLNKQPTQFAHSKENLCLLVDAYVADQIEKSAEAISCTVQEKISHGDVILTFGCSSLINLILEEARRRKVHFRIVLVDARPFCESQELLRRFTARGIPCSYVSISAIGFIMSEITKVILGPHALLANGYVMARTGTAQIALVAHSFNVPILVCCETHKFSQRVQTDSIVFNELGKSNEIVKRLNFKKNSLVDWRSLEKLYPLNLSYDITPPELLSAVVTEVSILPCSSVPVILRIRPTEIIY